MHCGEISDLTECENHVIPGGRGTNVYLPFVSTSLGFRHSNTMAHLYKIDTAEYLYSLLFYERQCDCNWDLLMMMSVFVTHSAEV